MAIIYSYPQPTLNGGILLVGSNTNEVGNPTININLDALANYILAFFNNNGTPYTHAMFITNDTIGDSYINQTPPDLVTYPTQMLFSNENHRMQKYLECRDNVYIGQAPSPVDKILTWSQDVEITTDNYTITTAVTQRYYGLEGHYGTEDHFGEVTFHNTVDFGDLTTTNVDNVNMWSKLQVYGMLLDSNLGSPGGPGQILSSTGVGVDWIDALPAGLTYMGAWDAFNNIPALASGVGNPGEYYIVSNDGTTNLDGNNTWEIGDWAIFSSTNVWQEIDNQNIFSGAGTTNTMTKFTGPTSLGDSQTTDDGTNIDMTAVGQLDLGGTPIVLTAGGGGIITGSPASFNSIVNLSNQVNLTGAVTDSVVSTGAAGQVLSSTGAGQVQWIDVSAGAGAISGSGTLNQIPKWTPSGTELGDSNISDNGTNIDIGPITGDFNITALAGAGQWQLGGGVELTSTAGDIILYDTDPASIVRLRQYDGVNFDNKVTVKQAGVDVQGDSVLIQSYSSGIDLNTGVGDITFSATGNTNFKKVGANKAYFEQPAQFVDAIIDQAGSTGAVGQILKNDGTGKINWSTFTPGIVGPIFEQAVTISQAELLNIAAVPKVLVSAPGVNFAIRVESIAIFKPLNVPYDFPEDLYVCESGNIGVATAKQAILDNTTANVGTVLRVVMPAVSSGSWVDASYRYGVTLSGNQDLVMTLDGLNPTVGTGDFTVVVNYRKINITTMAYSPV